MDGLYVRTAYNHEGYVSLAYRFANGSIGERWMLVYVGIALGMDQSEQTVARHKVWLTAADGRSVPLASNDDYLRLTTLQERVASIKEFLSFPARLIATSGPCSRLVTGEEWAVYDAFYRSFNHLSANSDPVTLKPGCPIVSHLLFPIDGGIVPGQYWINVRFDNGLVRVPFRIMDKDEAKAFEKDFKNIREQVRRTYGPQQESK